MAESLERLAAAIFGRGLAPLITLVLATCGGSTGPEFQCGTTSLPVPGSVTGSLDNGKCVDPLGGSGQVYDLSLPQQTNLMVSITASGFQPYVGVFTSSKRLVAETAATGRLKVFLPAGSFLVSAASANGPTGTYTLTTTPTELTGCTNPGTGIPSDADVGFTMKGATITGSLTEADCGGGNFPRFEVYAVHLVSGATLNVSVTVDRGVGILLLSPTGILASQAMDGAGTWTTSVTAISEGYFGVRLESNVGGLPVGYTIVLN